MVNCYEIILISLGLALSIYQDDASSFVYQLLMQVLLFYSVVEMGRYVRTQKKICIGVVVVLACFMLFKYWYMTETEQTLTQDRTKLEMTLKTLGFKIQVAADGTTTYLKWKSFEFETLSAILTGLLIYYYNG